MITISFQGETVEDIWSQIREQTQKHDSLTRHPTPAEQFVIDAAKDDGKAFAASAKQFTLDDVKETLRLTRSKVSLETPRLLLKKHGAGNVNDLPASEYGDIINEAQKLIDEKEREAKGVPATDDPMPF